MIKYTDCTFFHPRGLHGQKCLYNSNHWKAIKPTTYQGNRLMNYKSETWYIVIRGSRPLAKGDKIKVLADKDRTLVLDHATGEWPIALYAEEVLIGAELELYND